MHISVLLRCLMGLDDSNASSQGGPAFSSQYKQAHCMTFSLHDNIVLLFTEVWICITEHCLQ